MTAFDISPTPNDTLKSRIGIAVVVSVAAHLLLLGGAGLWARHAAPVIAETSPDAAQVTLIEAAEKTPPVPPTDTPAFALTPSPTPTAAPTPRPTPTKSPVIAPTPRPTPDAAPVSAFANAPAAFSYATPPPVPSATPTPQPTVATPAPTPFTPPPPVPAPAPKPMGFTRAAQIVALQNPDIPSNLRTGDKKISLRVRLDVDASGSVTGVILQKSSGNAEIDKRARETLMQAKFIPALVNGTPTASTYPFAFTF